MQTFLPPFYVPDLISPRVDLCFSSFYTMAVCWFQRSHDWNEDEKSPFKDAILFSCLFSASEWLSGQQAPGTCLSLPFQPIRSYSWGMECMCVCVCVCTKTLLSKVKVYQWPVSLWPWCNMEGFCFSDLVWGIQNPLLVQRHIALVRLTSFLLIRTHSASTWDS